MSATKGALDAARQLVQLSETHQRVGGGGLLQWPHDYLTMSLAWQPTRLHGKGLSTNYVTLREGDRESAIYRSRDKNV